MKRAVVLGMGVSGKAAAKLLLHLGYEVFGIDSRAVAVDGITMVKEAGDIVPHPVLAVMSPGVPPTNPDYQFLINMGIELIGEAELGCRHLRSKAVAITGTNGKTTVTALVTHVLNSLGIAAEAIGNFGLPICEFVMQPDHEKKIAIVELSSYQLETLTSKVFIAGALLNITPDHLDRYPSLEGYAQAKWNIERCLHPNAPLFIDEETYKTWAPVLGKLHATFFTGKNHLEKNFIAAELLCRSLGVKKEDFKRHAATFKHLPHRIELVETIDGVQWINDSKGTNIDAAIQAVKICSGPIVLIAGGVDKGSSYLPWVQGFEGKVIHICAIGQAASIIYRELHGILPVSIYNTMAAAVAGARELAIEGGTVLLSPGCSSFDMFRDYPHRGEVFKELVRELKLKKGCHR